MNSQISSDQVVSRTTVHARPSIRHRFAHGVTARLVCSVALAALAGASIALADDRPGKTEPPVDKPAKTDEKPASADEAVRDHAVIMTSMGQIVVKLDAEKAPVTVENFLRYIDDDFYNGTIFHRVISNFMIQGGGFSPDLTERPTRAPIVNEASNGLKNVRGTIAMARKSPPHTATAQFYINVQDNPALDHNPARRADGYAVFGTVVAGMDVVDRIREVPTSTQRMHQNVPREPVVIERIVAVDAKTAKRKIEAAARPDGQKKEPKESDTAPPKDAKDKIDGVRE